jgi:hypothetical protein
MLIVRCAWHRRYHGVGRLLGVASWRGLHVTFTDGICPKCAARVRTGVRVSRAAGPAAAERAGWMPGIAVVVVAVMIAVLLIARPTHDAVLTSLPPAPTAVDTVPAASPASQPLVQPLPGGIREPRVALAARSRYTSGRESVRRPPGLYRSPAHRDPGQSP